MKQVRRIHRVRRLTSKTALMRYATVGLCVALLSMVSLTNVYANMPSILTPTKLFDFIVRALLDTELLVQTTLLLLGIVGTLSVRDMFVQLRKGSKPLFVQS
jgi:hypothetical protein